MIPKVKEFKLIAMYFYISDIYDKELKYSWQRFSNNSEPDFTDPKIITIYLYAMHIEQRFKIKQTYEYASDHLRSWFPLFPSYEAFNMGLNRLGEAFRLLAAHITGMFVPPDCATDNSLLDSMSIITYFGKQQG